MNRSTFYYLFSLADYAHTRVYTYTGSDKYTIHIYVNEDDVYDLTLLSTKYMTVR